MMVAKGPLHSERTFLGAFFFDKQWFHFLPECFADSSPLRFNFYFYATVERTGVFKKVAFNIDIGHFQFAIAFSIDMQDPFTVSLFSSPVLEPILNGLSPIY